MPESQPSIFASFGPVNIARKSTPWQSKATNPTDIFDVKEMLRFAPMEAAAEQIRKDMRSYIQGSYVAKPGICYLVDMTEDLVESLKWSGWTSPTSPELDNAITESRKILDIQVAPDDGIEIRYHEETWKRATTLLRWLAQAFWAENASSFLPVPSIGPAEAGSIDLFWELTDLTLLINIPADAAKTATFYGRRLNTSKISGSLGNGDTEPRHLTGWLAGRE
jgi:hypothetical protein